MIAAPRTGRMRERVGLERLVGTADAFGDPAAREWEEYAERSAEVVALAGRELAQAQKIVADAAYAVKIRFTDGVEASHRVTWRDLTLNVAAVLPTDKLTHLMLLCNVPAAKAPTRATT